MSTIGLAALVSQVMPMAGTVNEMILLIGLAVGVDYTLFYIKREREERAAGRGEEAALEAAASTSGRAVLISGLTVMVAMAGLYFGGDAQFASMATGGIMVVLVALIASITVLPAILSKLGDKVEKGRVPFMRRRRDANPSESRAWSWVLDRVLKRPRRQRRDLRRHSRRHGAAHAGPAHGAAGYRHAPAQHPGDADLRPHAGLVPR